MNIDMTKIATTTLTALALLVAHPVARGADGEIASEAKTAKVNFDSPVKFNFAMGTDNPETTWQYDSPGYTLGKDYIYLLPQYQPSIVSPELDLSKFDRPVLYLTGTKEIQIKESTDGTTFGDWISHETSSNGYLLIPLSKNTKKIKLAGSPTSRTRIYDILILDVREPIVDVADGDIINYTPVDDIVPNGWSAYNFDGSTVTYVPHNNDYDGYLKAEVIETPIFDVSDCEKPILNINSNSSYYIQYSRDGVNFEESLGTDRTPCLLPRDVKKIKIFVPLWAQYRSKIELYEFSIRDYADSEIEDITYSLNLKYTPPVDQSKTVTFNRGRNLTTLTDSKAIKTLAALEPHYGASGIKFNYTYHFQKIDGYWYVLDPESEKTISSQASALALNPKETIVKLSVRGLSEPQYKTPTLSSKSVNWYDLDGDGVIENIGGSIYKLAELGHFSSVADIKFNRYPVSSVGDYNNDGHIDILTTSGIVFGRDGSYLQYPISGNVTFRDFNGDGILDYIGNDQSAKRLSIFFSQPDGSAPKETKLLSSIKVNSKIYCFDFDHDGDVDILAPCDSYNGNAYLVMIENQGNGKFKRHENLFEGNNIKFYDCVDFDGDKNYEILYSLPDKKNSYVKLLGVNSISEPIEIDFDASYPVIDVLNNGRMSAYTGGLYKPLCDYENQRPNAPSKPTLSYDRSNQRLTVKWDAASDKESSPVDLSYALRIGSTPEGHDMMNADALTDGRRRNILEGNIGYARQRMIDVSTWPKGKYYVSVQAIDPCHAGSHFSAVAIFDKTDDAVGFELSHPLPVGVGETVVVHTHYPASAFDFGDGANIVEVDSPAPECIYVAYSTPGTKTVSLMLPGGRSEAFEVIPAALRNESLLLTEEGRYLGISLAADILGDGRLEIMENHVNSFTGAYTLSRFYAQEPELNCYSEIKKLWNTNMPPAHYSFTDLNHDGLFDLISLDGKNGHTFTNFGDADGELDDFSSAEWGSNLYYDFNNDGFIDGISNYSLYINSGDNANFEEIGFSNSIDGSYVDINGDGLIDIAVPHYRKAYINNGDFTFSTQDFFKDANYGTAIDVVDLDHDGNIDVIFSRGVAWGGGNDNAFTAFDEEIKDVERVIDIDNDGFDEIILRRSVAYLGSTKSTWNIIHQHPDRSFSETEASYDTYEFSRIAGNVFYRDQENRMRYGELVLNGENTRPEAPRNLRHTQNDRFVVIEWDPAKDKESRPGQMKYNISVKRKGGDPESAYLISPLNGGDAGMPLPQPYPYLTSTRFSIPLASIPAGEYEVSVQALDAWMEQSEFSETLTINVAESATFDAPASVRIDNAATIKVLTNSTEKPDFGSADVTPTSTPDVYQVAWHTPGVKTIKLGSHSQNILVVEAPEGDFAVVSQARVGDSRHISCATANEGTWLIFDGDKQADDAVSIETTDEGSLLASFSKTGDYNLVHRVSDILGAFDYSHAVSVLEATPVEIDCVGIDDASGRYALTPVATSADQIAVNVYKETVVAGKYAKVASNHNFGSRFVDEASNPTVSAARYMVRAVYADGGESAPSIVHQPVHAMINRAAGPGWNLMWTKYEGHDVESYRIMRGDDASSLSIVDVVSGSLSSYYDSTAPDGTLYYAIEPLFATTATAALRAPAAGAKVMSNVVSTADASEITLARSLTIKADYGTDIDVDSPVQLVAYLEPSNATVKNVNWQLELGVFATVKDGEVSIIPDMGGGLIIVKASTIDGSGLEDTFELQYDDPVIYIDKIELSQSIVNGIVGDEYTLNYTTTPAITTFDVVFSVANPEIASIDQNGRLLLLAEGETDVFATAADGHGAQASCHVVVKKQSAISTPSASAVKIDVIDNVITVSGAEAGTAIEIFGVDGTLTKSAISEGAIVEIPMSTSGVYMVRAAETIGKVVVR